MKFWRVQAMNPMKLNSALVVARQLLLSAAAGSVRHAQELYDRAYGRVTVPLDLKLDVTDSFREAAENFASLKGRR